MRIIASLITDIGILTNRGMEDFYKIFEIYQERGITNDKEVAKQLEARLEEYRAGGVTKIRPLPKGAVKCVGVWDTVGALGIRKCFDMFLHTNRSVCRICHLCFGC